MAYFDWRAHLARCLVILSKLLRGQSLAMTLAIWRCQVLRRVAAQPPGFIRHVQPLLYWLAFGQLATTIGIITAPRSGLVTSSSSAAPQVRGAAT